jgi:TonB family protein
MRALWVAAALVLMTAGCSSSEVPQEHPVNQTEPPLPAGVFRPSQVDVRPVPTHEVEPDYPPELGSILTGQATVVFTVRPDGKVTDAAVVQADDVLFGEAARHAIYKWRFRPAEIKSNPVACRLVLPFVFTSPYGFYSIGGPTPDHPSDSPPIENRATEVTPHE